MCSSSVGCAKGPRRMAASISGDESFAMRGGEATLADAASGGGGDVAGSGRGGKILPQVGSLIDTGSDERLARVRRGALADAHRVLGVVGGTRLWLLSSEAADIAAWSPRRYAARSAPVARSLLSVSTRAPSATAWKTFSPAS